MVQVILVCSEEGSLSAEMQILQAVHAAVAESGRTHVMVYAVDQACKLEVQNLCAAYLVLHLDVFGLAQLVSPAGGAEPRASWSGSLAPSAAAAANSNAEGDYHLHL